MLHARGGYERYTLLIICVRPGSGSVFFVIAGRGLLVRL